jgi:hypothetical protein
MRDSGAVAETAFFHHHQQNGISHGRWCHIPPIEFQTLLLSQLPVSRPSYQNTHMSGNPQGNNSTHQTHRHTVPVKSLDTPTHSRVWNAILTALKEFPHMLSTCWLSFLHSAAQLISNHLNWVENSKNEDFLLNE